jgi:hypothetical protein
MTTKLPVACDSCIRRLTDTTCQAFPEEIPDDILVWGEPHNTPTKGQKNTIVWEFAPGTEGEFQDWKESREPVLK